MIIHVLFQVIVLLMGLALMVLALRFDVELIDVCSELYKNPDDLTTTREASRVILAMGTLMFSAAATVMTYSFMMANAQASRLKNPTYLTILIYICFVAIAGIVILIAAGIIQSNIESDCKNSDEIEKMNKYISGFWWVGGLSTLIPVVLFIAFAVLVPKTDKGKWNLSKRSGIDRTKSAELSEEEGIIEKRKAEAKVISEKAKKDQEAKEAKKKAEETKKETEKKNIDNYIEFNSKAMKYKTQAKEQLENYIEIYEKQYPAWEKTFRDQKNGILKTFDKQYESYCKDTEDKDGKVKRDVVKQNCEANVGKAGNTLLKTYENKVYKNLEKWRAEQKKEENLGVLAKQLKLYEQRKAMQNKK